MISIHNSEIINSGEKGADTGKQGLSPKSRETLVRLAYIHQEFKMMVNENHLFFSVGNE